MVCSVGYYLPIYGRNGRAVAQDPPAVRCNPCGATIAVLRSSAVPVSLSALSFVDDI